MIAGTHALTFVVILTMLAFQLWGLLLVVPALCYWDCYWRWHDEEVQ